MPGDFPDKNGCTLIVVNQKDFDRVVLSSIATTFHWRSTPDYRAPVQQCLATLVEEMKLTSVDGNAQGHDRMHLDLEDAATPELHMHILGDIDDEDFRTNIHALIERLEAKGHLTTQELETIKRGITAHNNWT
ncbi:hypothetical protein [Pseudomonas sp. NPDC086278]|uniref:hypothetical protein n=1 Tax=Pseudomonas sp. NPDC086278 TaxID=3390646 RepID=UPI003CFDDFC4